MVNKNGDLIGKITNDKNTGTETTKFYDKSGNISYIKEENKITGIEIYKDYNELGNISYIRETHKNTGLTILTKYNNFGNISYIKEEDKKTGINKTTHYNESGNIIYVEEEDKKTGEVEFSVINKNKTTVYKLRDGESPILGLKYTYLNYRDKFMHSKTIEDLKDGGKKIEEGNKVTYTYPEHTTVVLYREDQNRTRYQAVTDKDNERVLKKYDMSGENITSILRTSKKMPVEIEEYFEKGKLFPTFKIDNIEIPLVSLDKYKEVCQKYNIEPLPEVLSANEPPAPKQESSLEKFIGFFNR